MTNDEYRQWATSQEQLWQERRKTMTLDSANITEYDRLKASEAKTPLQYKSYADLERENAELRAQLSALHPLADVAWVDSELTSRID